MIRRPPKSPLFPYPPLFGSLGQELRGGHGRGVDVLGGYRDPRRAQTVGELGRSLRRVVREEEERAARAPRSEEHTSELQSHLNIVCRLLLEKKKEIIRDISA